MAGGDSVEETVEMESSTEDQATIAMCVKTEANSAPGDIHKKARKHQVTKAQVNINSLNHRLSVS